MPPDRPTPTPRWVTRPLAAVYGMEIGRRNRRYDRGLGVTRLDRPVISVGNISAGGTGKTPMVRWLVRALQDAGSHPAVAMRGYKAGSGTASDEEREHREALPGVPVVAQPDRIEGLRALFASEAGRSVDRVVLDDGFQHRRLARDLDIVLVDASRPPDRDALLPDGFLREPLGSLGRADAVVITHAELVDEAEIVRIRGVLCDSLRPGVPLAVAEHRWIDLWAPGPPEERFDPEWLRGRRVVAACAIGNPSGFLAGLERAGAEQCGVVVLPDHDPFGPESIGRIQTLLKTQRPDALVVTTKDWVKLREIDTRWSCPVIIPTLGLWFRAGDNQLTRLLSRVG